MIIHTESTDKKSTNKMEKKGMATNKKKHQLTDMIRCAQMMLMMMVVMQARDMHHHFQSHTLWVIGVCVCVCNFCFFPLTLTPLIS